MNLQGLVQCGRSDGFMCMKMHAEGMKGHMDGAHGVRGGGVGWRRKKQFLTKGIRNVFAGESISN